jgi:hypothetical protein
MRHGDALVRGRVGKIFSPERGRFSATRDAVIFANHDLS